MKGLTLWLYIIGALAIAVLGNTVSTVWAKEADKFNLWLLAVIIISPFVYISFGLVTSKMGLTIASGVIDSLLTVSTIAVGLIFFQEWSKISVVQYVGMAFALSGMFMMLFFPKLTT
jgi:multidrug transporter EmrE-like cation transporter